MKILFKTSFILVLLGLLTLNSNCKKNIFHKVTYEGYVYDSIGGNPAVGIVVSLKACSDKNSGQSQCTSYDVGRSTTDGSGHFKIHEFSASSNRYAVVAGSTYYEPYFNTHESDLKTDKFTTLYLYPR